MLNVAADHLGLRGIDTVEDLARVKRVVVEVATDAAVLNADDPLCLKMADHSSADHLTYVTMNPRHPLVREHIGADGRAVVLEEGMNGHMITIYDAGRHLPLLWTHLIPATVEGKAIHNVQNAMFAAGIAYSMGVGLEDIRQGLRTFDTTYFQAPGRLNVYDDHPFKVILDYAHNPHAVEAMVRLVDNLGAEGAKICVVGAPGDRRDEDIDEIARICAGHFDHYLCRRDDNLRGRGSDEVPERLRAGLVAAGVDESLIEVIPDEQECIHAALSRASHGDLLLVMGDSIRRCWRQITTFSPDLEIPAPAEATRKPPPVEVIDQLPELNLPSFEHLVRDERGVRLAREEEND